MYRDAGCATTGTGVAAPAAGATRAPASLKSSVTVWVAAVFTTAIRYCEPA